MAIGIGGKRKNVEQEKTSRRWRPTNRQVLWAIGMVVALTTLVISIRRLVQPYFWFPDIVEPPEWLLSQSTLPIIGIALALLAVVTLLIIGGAQYGWTGFGGKSLWDWLQLLIVPLVLATVGLWFAWSQDARQRVTEENRAMDTALQAYLEEMSRLLIEEDLHGAQPGDNLSDVARARTLTVLDQLDGERRGDVLQFLYEAELINKEGPVLTLVGADLGEASSVEDDFSGANLKDVFLDNSDLSLTNLDGAILSDAALGNADLSESSLVGADLSDAHIYDSDLSKATLVDADLSDAILNGANLRGANLEGANLSNAFLWEADLRKANLEGTDLRDADLSDANLSGAKGITNEQLEKQTGGGIYLQGATMADGSTHD
jgi:uncharacterized protein YjbI with pentapeptide repeats